MKRIVTFIRKDFEAVRNHLLKGYQVDEEAAFLVAGISETTQQLNFLIRRVIPVPDGSLLTKGPAGLQINPDFISIVLKECRQKNFSVILAHSHPFSRATVGFSSIDDYGERQLFPKIQQRIPRRHHGTMVFGQSSVDARIWLGDSKRKTLAVDIIKVIGNTIEIIYSSSAVNIPYYKPEEIYNRQILALTKEGQSLIRKTSVGIVGLGGVGSQVFQQLVHLGVESFILVDNDTVEESNLSRMVGTTAKDAKLKIPKVKIMAELGEEINRRIKVVEVSDTVYHNSAALKLRNADIIFCCTDTMVSRMVLSRVAEQYLIPVIDMGIDIQSGTDGNIERIGGRVMIVYPDGPCLECMGIINHDMLSKETMSPSIGTQRNPYIQGINAPAPSVISLNGVIASLAVTEFINLLTGCLERTNGKVYHVYDGKKGVVRAVQMTPLQKCKICREVRALGDNVELPCILNK